jgi:erythronate-4-phosphate dehydrogenase
VDDQLSARSENDWSVVRMLISQAYNIATDDQQLRNLARRADLGQDDFDLGFDHLRKHYPERREFHNYRVNLTVSHEADDSIKNESLTRWLATLGFALT